MQAQQPAYGTAAQGQSAGGATLATGNDAWARSVVLVIGGIAVVGVLFVGALLLMYFGTVQPKGTLEVVALDVVNPSAPVLTPRPIVVISEPTPAARESAVETPTRTEMPPVTTATVTARAARGTTAVAAAGPAPVPIPAATLAANRAVPPPPSTAISVSPRTTVSETGVAQETERLVPVAVQRELVAAAPSETAVGAVVSQPASPPPTEAPLKTEAVAPPPAIPAVLATPPSTETKPVQIAAIEPPAVARPSPVASPRTDPPEALPPVVLRPVSRPQPQFPRQALNEGVTRGSVVARVTVATDGRVSAVTIVSSNPPKLFDRAAQNTLAEWRFEPIPRPTTAQVELAFRSE